MTGQDKSLTKKRGRPEGVTHSEFIGLRLPSSLAGSLDAWIAAQPEPGPTRSEAIRRLLAEALAKPTDAGSIPAEDLNVSNDE